MITSIAYDRQKNEAVVLNDIVKDLAARLTDEMWDIRSMNAIRELKEFLEDKPLMDILLYDIDTTSDVELLKEIRSDYRFAYIMLIADSGISPMKYMNPHIKAQSLLLRPFTPSQAGEVLNEMIIDYVGTNIENKPDEGNVFSVDLRDEGRINIPYEKISFFEAMDKKVYVCAGLDEYGFYDSLDALEDRLPDNFKRCHRSYIVNMDKILRVAVSKNTIYLADEMEVPLSRSYKPDFKDVRSVKQYGEGI